jgi:hypothetical protein
MMVMDQKIGVKINKLDWGGYMCPETMFGKIVLRQESGSLVFAAVIQNKTTLLNDKALQRYLNQIHLFNNNDNKVL